MLRLRELKDCVTGEPYLRGEDGREYRRAACALCWPAPPLPGCVVALGEARRAPTVAGTERRHLHLLFEEWSDSPRALIDHAERALRLCRARRAVTPDDDPRIALVDAANDARREERLPPLRTEPPLAWHGQGEGLLPYYLSLLHARVVDAKTLHLGTDSRLPASIAQADSPDIPARTAMLRWPGLCALGWAVEALDMRPMREWGREWGRNRSARPTGMEGPADMLGGY